MPVCADESVGRLWSRDTGGSTPPSPISCSPPNLLIRSASDTFTVVDRRYLTPSPPPHVEGQSILTRLIGWYPSFVLKFARNLIAALFYLTWSQCILLGPAIWLTAWLWIFWKCVQMPLVFAKWVLTMVFLPASVRMKRTVLISGGSTIQTLHLARNFYSAGARVVVFEVEGLFGLSKFSAAVDKFYTVPRPVGQQAEDYIEAVKSIVAAEKATFYVPTCVSSTAYYEAMLKPHLELMGCNVFSPGLKEVCVLDDPYELLRKCRTEGLTVPEYYLVTSIEEIDGLYEDGILTYGRYLMFSSGQHGCRERAKLVLPRTRREFKAPVIAPSRPWVIVKDYPGDHFVTCTTVKDSKVIANVTCLVDQDGSGSKMVPVNHKEIEIWLSKLFSKLGFLRLVSGQMSFSFVESTASGSIVPIGCQVGVSLPYICHTSAHSKLIWKPCRHISSQGAGPLVSHQGRYWMHEAVIDTIKNPSVEKMTDFIGTMLDKREALFCYWDPIPYCAYYHIQLPFNNIIRFIQGQNGRHHGFHSPALATGQ